MSNLPPGCTEKDIERAAGPSDEEGCIECGNDLEDACFDHPVCEGCAGDFYLMESRALQMRVRALRIEVRRLRALIEEGGQ